MDDIVEVWVLGTKIVSREQNWRPVEFRRIADHRGNLTPVESRVDVPFAIERSYFIYDVPSGSHRAGHAHLNLQQVYLAVAGSFDVHLEDGGRRETITLNRPNVGIWIGPGVWREIDNFSSGAVCLVFASALFDEADYIREYSDFQRYAADRTDRIAKLVSSA